jgi:hypothetical protein
MVLAAVDMPDAMGREVEVAAARLLMRVWEMAPMGRPEVSTMLGLVRVGWLDMLDVEACWSVERGCSMLDVLC